MNPKYSNMSDNEPLFELHVCHSSNPSYHIPIRSQIVISMDVSLGGKIEGVTPP